MWASAGSRSFRLVDVCFFWQSASQGVLDRVVRQARAARPPVSFIETLDGEPPPLIPSSPNLQVEQLRLIAKLDVENTGKSLYMGEWGPPSVTTARYFVFVGDDHDPSKAQPWLALGDRLDQPLLLYDHDEITGRYDRRPPRERSTDPSIRFASRSSSLRAAGRSTRPTARSCGRLPTVGSSCSTRATAVAG